MMDNPPPFGFIFHNSTLVVQSVTPGGQAERAGIKSGWRILEFNGTSIADGSHYEALIAENKPKKKSDETYLPVRLTFQSGPGAAAGSGGGSTTLQVKMLACVQHAHACVRVRARRCLYVVMIP